MRCWISGKGPELKSRRQSRCLSCCRVVLFKHLTPNKKKQKKVLSWMVAKTNNTILTISNQLIERKEEEEVLRNCHGSLGRESS